MNLPIEIADSKTQNFSQEAEKELLVQSTEIINNLVDEVCRVEAARREGDSQQEITQADVKEGARASKIRRFKKKKLWQKIIQALIPVITIVLGYFFDPTSIVSIIIALIILPFVAIFTYIDISDNN